MTRRINAAPIKLTEMEALRERAAVANTLVVGLLATNGAYSSRIDAEVRTELQRIQGHLAYLQQQLRTMTER